MSSIARFVGTLLLSIIAWSYLDLIVPQGFWLMVVLLPLLWNLRNAKDDAKDPLGGSGSARANWLDELENFANTGKDRT